VDTDVSEEHAVSIFRAEVCGILDFDANTDGSGENAASFFRIEV
jgi:hypothetical protein